METMAAAPAPQQRTGRIARRLARLLRRKSSPAGAGGMAYSVAGDDLDDSLDSSINSLSKLKLSGNLAAAYTLDAFFKNATETKGAAAAAPQTQPSPAPAPAPVPAPGAQDAAKHAFVATLFARASAVKAAYAQLQLAQHPYDADSIQAADVGLVAELTKLSSLKRRYARDPAAAASRSAAAALALSAHADEQRHLLRTYEITARKLEAELRARDAEAERARAALADEVRAARGLEERTRTLASLDDLHLSGLNATHFLTALRHAVKSVRAFASAMLHAMRAAGWDPAAAAAAVHPGARLRDPAGDSRFALESYVTLKMFAGFHRKDLGLSSLHGRGASHDRRRFFEEFAEAKSAAAAELLVQDDAGRWGALREFLRDRYVSVVHERMEAAFFGGASSSAVPRAAWLGEFAEMARRVWLLHCLFWAFDGAAAVFQARPRDRFSEVFMESVSDADGGGGGGTTPVPAQAPSGHLAVGFTVVPGFQLGRTVIQCRVYLSDSKHRP